MVPEFRIDEDTVPSYPWLPLASRLDLESHSNCRSEDPSERSDFSGTLPRRAKLGCQDMRDHRLVAVLLFSPFVSGLWTWRMRSLARILLGYFTAMRVGSVWLVLRKFLRIASRKNAVLSPSGCSNVETASCTES